MSVTVIKGANLTVEGIGYMGDINEITLPPLAMNVAEHRAMGMDAPMPVDLGMEMLQLTFMTSGPDFGLHRLFGKRIQARISAVLEGTLTAVKSVVQIVAGGRLTSADLQTWNMAGELSPMSCQMSLDYYLVTVNGIKNVEIDVPGGIRFVDGFDALAEVRSLLGV